MAIEQLNSYMPGQNLNNLANNVDYNRLGDDKTLIEADFSGSPAEITVKIGSLWEVNGNLYTIDTADEVFTMDNAAHNYITFNEATEFGSAATAGTWDAEKQGFYQADGVTRTLCWYIDQTDEYTRRNLTLLIGNGEDVTAEDFYIENNLTANALTVETDLQVDNSLNVDNDVTIGDDLEVDGVSKFNNPVFMYNTLRIDSPGAVTSRAPIMEGTAGTLDASGNATITWNSASYGNLEFWSLVSAMVETASDQWESFGDYGTTPAIYLYDSTHGAYANKIRIVGGAGLASKNYKLLLLTYS